VERHAGLTLQPITRLSLNQTRRKTPGRDGTMHLVMSPLEFMQRLAALVQQPRLHPRRTASGP
jgi:hypothetical protein